MLIFHGTVQYRLFDMADFTAQNWSTTAIQADQYVPTVKTYALVSNPFSRMTLGSIRRIKMRWLDVDALPSVVYRIWSVTDEPDPTGRLYPTTSPKTGATPISGAIVVEDYIA